MFPGLWSISGRIFLYMYLEWIKLWILDRRKLFMLSNSRYDTKWISHMFLTLYTLYRILHKLLHFLLPLYVPNMQKLHLYDGAGMIELLGQVETIIFIGMQNGLKLENVLAGFLIRMRWVWQLEGKILQNLNRTWTESIWLSYQST